ncbi:TetR/AcrR family transcriptional regulator [Nocardioides litoris]|uniref:TetR/AcrR family transcriptional regulator n=1 Tax=Nocardioides litoris TaxID=1926648 RepID=UPI001B86F945|nr:TetR/AcrR family transcriptional regulator [Nocardioides litoris]
MPETVDSRADVRTAIVTAAAELLGEGGPAAVTTRGVAERAGVQVPTIYRLLGDKDGLLEAVVEHVMATYVSAKSEAAAASAAAGDDPVEAVRQSWRRQIEFGLANPWVFRLLNEPDRLQASPATRAGLDVLAARVRRVAAARRLRVSEDVAVGVIRAAGVGVVQLLLATAPEDRDPALAEVVLEAALGRILLDPPEPDPDSAGGPVAAAIALRAGLDDLDALSAAERGLLAEWLDRVVRDRA